MLSKLLRQSCRSGPIRLLAIRSPLKLNARKVAGMIPPNQYDVPIPKKLHITHAVVEYWETIPLFFVTFFALGFMFFSIFWACFNKVDVVFSTHNRSNISRTMDLRDPTVHKLIIINQKYRPWPEMQHALDSLKAAENQALARAQAGA